MIKFLQSPGKLKKYILGGILVFICIAMTTYLIPGFTGGSSFGSNSGVLAKVDGDDITVQEAQQEAQRMVRQQFRGRSIPASMMGFFTQQAVQQLVLRKAALAEAARMGLKVTDQDLQDYLKKDPNIFPNGQYIGDDTYAMYVQQQYDMSIPQYESQLKEALLIGMLQNLVAGTATVTDQEMQQDYTRKNTKVKFEYAVLSYDDILKQIKPTDAELRAFFDRNKDMYKNAIPEKRKAQYVVIDPSKLTDKVQVTPQDLRSYYSQHQDEFRVPEEVTLRQILIKAPQPGPDGKVDQKAVDAVRAKAQDVLNKIKAGGNFAELAKKYSEDPATANNGGLVGAVTRGRIYPDVDRAAFSMNKGQTSDLISTPMGFFIIRVDDKQSAHLKSLDEVKAQIEPMIARDKANALADNLATKVQADARANGLAAAASKNGLEVVNTDFVASTDALPGIGAAPEFMQALFQAKEKQPPESVRTAQGQVIFQVEAIQPPMSPTFDQIKQRVETDFKNERAGALLAQKVQQLSDRAHSQHNLKAAAKEVGATVKTSELVDPQGQVPDIGSMTGPASVAFTMKPGEISNALSIGRNGVVLAVLDKQEPTPAEFASNKDKVREELLADKRQEMMSLFISNLQTRMEKEKKIVINENEMKKLTPTSDFGE